MGKISEQMDTMKDNIRNLTEDSHSMKDHIYHLESRIDCPQPSALRHEGRIGLSNQEMNHSTPFGGPNSNENHTSAPYRHEIQRPQRYTGEKSHTKLKPQNYDGNEDFEEYLSQFEIIAQINNWDHVEKALYLAGCLGGGARSVLVELSPLERRDFDTLVNMLNVRDGSIQRSEMFRARLQTRDR